MNKNIRIKLLAALLSVIMLLSLAVPTYAITFSMALLPAVFVLTLK
jgi:hypothetical protein